MSNEFVHHGYAVSLHAREREPELWHWTADIKHPLEVLSYSQTTEICNPLTFPNSDEAIAYAKQSAISYIDYWIERYK